MLVILLKLNKEQYIEHIRDREQIINMRKILDKVEIVINKHICQATDFLDPYERKLAKSILNRFQDIKYIEFGGIDESERKIIQIFPDYLQYDELEMPIVAFKVEGYSGKLFHKNFLGSILGLGINRSKVGDILIHEGYCQFVVKEEISPYILTNLNKVGNERVTISQIPLEELKPVNIEYEHKRYTVSSLRLDVLISSVWNLSRKDSQKLIESERVKINWEPVDKPSKVVEVGSIISAKGYGRFILSSIEGVSKKERMKIEVKLLK